MKKCFVKGKEYTVQYGGICAMLFVNEDNKSMLNPYFDKYLIKCNIWKHFWNS